MVTERLRTLIQLENKKQTLDKKLEEQKLRQYRPNTQDSTHRWTNFKTVFLENGESANLKTTRLWEHINELFPKAAVLVACAFLILYFGENQP